MTKLKKFSLMGMRILYLLLSAPFFICFTLVRDHLGGKNSLVKNIAAVWILCGMQLVLPIYLLVNLNHN